MKPKISAFIITFNAEKHLKACLESLLWADEIILVDSGSTDGTLALARTYSVQLHTRPFRDFADQKNFAMALCKGDWLFSADSDEVVTPELRSEILSTAANPGIYAAYEVPRRSVIFGRIFRFSGTQNDHPVRLIKRGCGRFEQPIHEYVSVSGKTGRLQNLMMHYTYDTQADYFERFNRYTDREADFLIQKNYSVSWIDRWLRPPAMFLKLYFLKQGFRDGRAGFLFCFFSACYVFVKYSKYLKKLRKNRGTAAHKC